MGVVRTRKVMFGGAATVGAPSGVTIALGVLCAVLQAVAQLVLTAPDQYQYRVVISEVIIAFGTLSIQPLFGPGLDTLLHLSKQVLLFIGAVLVLANGVLTVVALPVAVHTVVAVVLTIIGAVVLGAPVIAPARASPAPRA